MQFDSIIFDLDGTLWDSTAACAVSWNRAVEKLSLPSRNFQPNDIASIMGMPHKKIYEKMFPSLSEAKRGDVAKTCYTEEIDLISKEGAAVYPGVEDGLKILQKHFSLYVLSNCLIEYLDTFLAVTQFSKYFKDSLCHGHTGQSKGHNMKLLVEKHKMKHPVYVGDTAGDHRSSLEAGVPYLHVSYGFGKPHEECPVFQSFPELVQHLISGAAKQ